MISNFTCTYVLIFTIHCDFVFDLSCFQFQGQMQICIYVHIINTIDNKSFLFYI